MNLAPIVLFVYNRPYHTKQTVDALKKNDLANQSELFIYSDASKNENAVEKVNEVREYIKSVDGFKKVTIIEREKNWGLANSIIDGVTKIVSEYGKIIILEDDLVTSPYFLNFLNDSLLIYQEEKQVGMIHGHIYNIPNLPDLFFMYKAGCLGWGTWVDRWNQISFDGKDLLKRIQQKNLSKKFDVNRSYNYTKMLKQQIKGKNSSWAIRVYASFLLNDKLTFYPGESLVQHIGYDMGTHCGEGKCASDMDGFISSKKIEAKKIDAVNSKEALYSLEIFYNSQKVSFIKRVKNKLKRILKLS